MRKMENNQFIYALFLDTTNALDRVCYSELFNILLGKKSSHCTIARLSVYQSSLLCKMEQQNSTD